MDLQPRVHDAEFRLVRPPRLFRPWAVVAFGFFVYLLAAAAAKFAASDADKAALAGLVVSAALIAPAWRLFSSVGARVSDAEAEWLARRLGHPER